MDLELRDCMEAALKTLALRADEKGLELLCDFAAEVPDMVKGDPGRLRQILVNLVGNAIKFTDKGEVALKVELGAGGGEPGYSSFCSLGHGNRHCHRQARLDLRIFRSGGHIDHPRIRRYRPWTYYLQTADRTDGRNNMDRKCSGRWITLSFHPSA